MKTTFFMYLVCRAFLLCDKCNWEFAGFAIPGTMSNHSKKRRKNESKKPASFASSETSEQIEVTDDVHAYEHNATETDSDAQHTQDYDSTNPQKIKKRVRVKMKK